MVVRKSARPRVSAPPRARLRTAHDPVPSYRPQLARLVKAPPEGDEWLHEMKYDGYRIGCSIDRGKITLISRNGKDWTAAFPEITKAARELGVRQALIDGEIAIVLSDGRTSFQALQNAFSGGPRSGLVYFVFDLLHVGGETIASKPLVERKDELLRLVGSASVRSRIRYSDHVAGRGREMFAEACRLGLEGVISKRADAPYKAGRAESWVKTKCVRRQEFVLGGFTDPEGSRQGIGALLVGVYDPHGNLVFAGKVGTGFTTAVARSLRQQLERIEQSACPFTPRPAGWLGKNAHWVEPRLVAEVAFTEWTGDGHVRHPSFQGLRQDKPPSSVVREYEADAPEAVSGPDLDARPLRTAPSSMPRRAARRSDAVEVAGVRITHPDRVMYPEAGITKVDVARAYVEIADWIVPHVEDRPLTLVRCPEGISSGCFYMKHSKVWAPEAIRRVHIREKTKIGQYLVADSIAAVVSLVQMDVLEIHTWNSRTSKVEYPDRIVIDIDPGAKVAWAQVIAAARLVRRLLGDLELDGFVKTTGGRGLHVVVPLAPVSEWRECLDFSRALAEAMVRHDPDTFTTTFAKAGRERKILIDYLRNNRTNTSIAAYSTRARAGAPVSVPVRWEELKPTLDPSALTIRTIAGRLSRLRQDPWADYWKTKQRLTARMTQAVKQT
jgi:bifunctional non-homologous end joining protein LigD